jgi:DNA-binding transcriptional LysR family regulator
MFYHCDPMLSPQDVSYFLAIAQHLSLRAAAAELHVTQPALSHSLKRLERELETQVFERTARGLRLTPAGQTLQSESKSALAQWQTLGHSKPSASARVRIGMHASVATYIAPTLLKALTEADLTRGMEFTHALSRDLVRQVLEGELDLALAMNPSEHPSLVIREILTDHVSVYVSSKKQDQTDHLIYDPALAQSQWMIRSLRRMGHKFQTHTHSGSLEVIRAIAEEGLGAAILPARVAALARKPLFRYLKSGPTYRDRLCIVTRPHFARHEPGKSWLKAIREIADDRTLENPIL